MKVSITSIVIFPFCVLWIGCSSDSSNSDKEIEKCWTIVDNSTGEPIVGASLNISYNWPDSELGPFGKYPVADINGKACAIFPEGYYILTASAWASGYNASQTFMRSIPDVIRLNPL